MNGNDELNRRFPHLKSQQQSFITPRTVTLRTAEGRPVTWYKPDHRISHDTNRLVRAHDVKNDLFTAFHVLPNLNFLE